MSKGIKIGDCLKCPKQRECFPTIIPKYEFSIPSDCPLPDWPRITDKELRELVLDMMTEAFPLHQLKNKLRSKGMEVVEGEKDGK